MSEQIPGRLRLQAAQLFALADARCGSDQHNEITRQPECPACHRSLIDYLRLMPAEWPA